MRAISFLRWLRAAVAAAAVVVGCGSARAQIPASAYVQDGLVAQWDALEKPLAAAPGNWTDLKRGDTIPLLADDAVDDTSVRISAVSHSLECLKGCDFDFRAPMTLEVRAKTAVYAVSKSYAMFTFKYRAALQLDTRHSPAGGSCFNAAFPDGNGTTLRLYYDNLKSLDRTETAKYHSYSAASELSKTCTAYCDGLPCTFSGNLNWTDTTNGYGTPDGTASLGGANGAIDYQSIRIYNRALTAEEVSRNAMLDKLRFGSAASDYRWNAEKECVEYRVSAQGTDGATVSVDGATYAQSVATDWTELGTPVTVTVSAQVPQGCAVSSWEGVPIGATVVRNVNSITLTVSEAASLKLVVHTCQTLHWRGGTDALASKPANWVDGEGNPAAAAPLTGDAIVIDAQSTNQAMTWDLDEVVPASWTQTGWAGTVTFMTGSVGRKANNVAQPVHGASCDEGSNVEFRVSGDVTVMSGKWTVTATPSFKATDTGWIDGLGVYRLLVRVGGDFTVGADASVSVMSGGFLGRQGPGYSTASGNGQPASHGGGAINMNGGKLMPCYGDVKAPVTIGSGGASPTGGGGAIRIFVDGATTLNGSLNASTTEAADWYASAGGSVYLRTGTLSGSGPIAANGQRARNYGSGGGGRIALVLTGEGADFTAFTGDVSAYGGYTSEKSIGSPGTIYYETPADGGKGKLVVRGVNGTVPSTTDIVRGMTTGLTGVLAPSTTYEFSEIVVTNGASLGIGTNVTVKVAKLTGYNRDIDHVTLHGGTLIIPTGLTIEGLAIGSREIGGGRVEFSGVVDGARGKLTIGNGGRIGSDKALTVDGDLEIADGGCAKHTTNTSSDSAYRLDLTVTGDLTIDEGAIVDGRGGGVTQYNGPKPGNNHNYGGSYGGKAYNAPNMRCYGSIKSPFVCGSGPGYAGRSGGCIKLSVNGNLTMNGTVDATAQIATEWTGGGAGGSVWISARALFGSGEIKADGGHVPNNGGECGGGGRISVTLTGADSVFADSAVRIHAHGGRKASLTGEIRGGAGTIYLREGNEDEEGGTLIVDGGRESGSCAQTEITTDVTDTSFDTVIITNGASLKQYQDTTITVRKDWLNYGTYAAEIADAEHAAGTVVFTNAAATARVVGRNPFAAFTCETPGKRFEFGTGANDALSIVEGGKLTLLGADAASERIMLRPATANETWTISIADGASTEMEGLDVAGSVASSSPTKPVARNSVDSGDNADWNFVNIHEGEVITWTGVNSTSWNQPDNWDLRRVPVPTDEIVIPTGSPKVPTFNEPLTLAKLTVEAGAALDLATYGLTVTGALTVNGRLLARSAELIELRGDVSFAAGAFDCARSTIVLAGTADKTADFGDNVLWDIRFGRDGTTTTVTGGFAAQRVWAQPATAATLAFEQDVSVVAREWWLGGVDGVTPLLTLTSVGVGRPWNFTAVAHVWVRGVRVRDSNAAGGNAVFAQAPCEDLAGNVNWRLGVVATEWTGESDTAFENPSNWSTGKVPGADDLVVLNEGAAVVVPAEGATVGELHVEGASAVSGGRLTTVGSAYVRCGELTLDAPLTVGQDLEVRVAGSITHTANGTADSHRVDIAVVRDLYVWPDGQIHANAKGYSAGQGPGKPSGTSAGSSHGGRGNGNAVCYGSFRHPVESGSGGGSWNGAGKAWGGGVISIDVKGTTTVEGGVTANGERKDWYGPSGGSVYLSTRFLAGDGTISANGGNLVNGGLGGGGRVAVYLTDASATFDGFAAGSISAYGGRSDATSNDVGGPGTVFLSLASDSVSGGTLIVDNGDVAKYARAYGSGADFPLVDEQDHRQNANLKVVLGKYGYVVSRGPMTVGELELDSTSRINLNGNVLAIRSRAHNQGKGWPSNWQTAIVIPGVDAEGNPGRIVWLPRPLALIVR